MNRSETLISSNKMSTVDLIANDPVLAAMANGDIPWGDLLFRILIFHIVRIGLIQRYYNSTSNRVT